MLTQCRTLFGMMVASVVASLLIGCGSGAETPPPSSDSRGAVEQPASASGSTRESSSTLRSGDASAALGVTEWEVANASTIRGRDAAGNVVAEFFVDTNAGIIRGVLPNGGARSIADLSNNTLSSESDALLNAFTTDLNVRLAEEKAQRAVDELVNKDVYGCYRTYYDCDIAGFQGILNGWWIGYVCQYPSASCASTVWPWALVY